MYILIQEPPCPSFSPSFLGQLQWNRLKLGFSLGAFNVSFRHRPQIYASPSPALACLQVFSCKMKPEPKELQSFPNEIRGPEGLVLWLKDQKLFPINVHAAAALCVGMDSAHHWQQAFWSVTTFFNQPVDNRCTSGVGCRILRASAYNLMFGH